MSNEENAQLMNYIIATYGHNIMGRKSEVLRDALSEYLRNHAIEKSSNREIAKAPPVSEKKHEKEKIPPETKAPEGRKWHGGKAPYESQYPEIAARVMELWAGGKKAGGMSRDAVAKAMRDEGTPMTAALVDKITARARKKEI